MAKRQLRIAGTESKNHPDVEAAAEALYELRISRIAIQKDEGPAEQKLIDALKAAKLTVYTYQGDEGEMSVELVPTREKVKLKKQKDDAELDD